VIRKRLHPAHLKRVASAAASVPARRLATWRAGRGLSIRQSTAWVTCEAGYRLHLRVHEPDDVEPRPAVVLVPGRGGDASSFEGLFVVNATELAARGLRVFALDPLGRGRSWGHDDFGGAEGQDGLRAALDLVRTRRDVQADRLVLMSFGLGLTLAAPLLVREADRIPVAALIDWEGPADRRMILRTGPLPPAARTALSANPEHFWTSREPVRWVPRLPCRYHRIQAREDHALGQQGGEAGLALAREALRGDGPEVWWNGQAAGAALTEAPWAPSDTAGLNRLLLSATLDAVS
jgi:pimeloyl-ACP methyl ester carboxylesterase